MKLYITLAVVCLIASAVAHDKLPEEEKAKMLVQFQECVKQENVSEEDVTKLQKKDLSNATPGMKCFGACFFEKVGILKDSVVQEDLVLKKYAPYYGEENVKKVLEKCKNEKGADRCDTGFKVYECAEKATAEWDH